MSPAGIMDWAAAVLIVSLAVIVVILAVGFIWAALSALFEG